MKYNAIIDKMLPDELRILQRRLDDLSLLMFTEAAEELDNNGELPTDLKDGIAASKSELMMRIFTSMARVRRLMDMLKEDQASKWN